MREMRVDDTPFEGERVQIPVTVEPPDQRGCGIDHDQHVDIRRGSRLAASPRAQYQHAEQSTTEDVARASDDQRPDDRESLSIGGSSQPAYAELVEGQAEIGRRPHQRAMQLNRQPQ